jgi:hypothetical protein
MTNPVCSLRTSQFKNSIAHLVGLQRLNLESDSRCRDGEKVVMVTEVEGGMDAGGGTAPYLTVD